MVMSTSGQKEIQTGEIPVKQAEGKKVRRKNEHVRSFESVA